MYFRVEQGLISPTDNNVTINITYLDDTPNDSFDIQYNSTQGAYKRSNLIQKNGTGKWVQATLNLTDANFTHAENNGSDFRIEPGANPVFVQSVSVQ
jgi:hypothetical protein